MTAVTAESDERQRARRSVRLALAHALLALAVLAVFVIAQVIRA